MEGRGGGERKGRKEIGGGEGKSILLTTHACHSLGIEKLPVR